MDSVASGAWMLISERKWQHLRRLEVALASLLLASAVLIVLPVELPIPESVGGILVLVLTAVFPLALAVTALLLVVYGDIGLGSLLTLVLVFVTAYFSGSTIVMWLGLVSPAGDGGVIFVHFFSYLAALGLAVLALMRRQIDRTFARIFYWDRSGRDRS